MCTVTVTRRDHDTIICMTRDERRDRAPETAPIMWPQGFIAPRDMDRGGTWIAVRPTDGVWAALLNGYNEDAQSPRATNFAASRGDIIPAILAEGANPRLAFTTLDPTSYPSFRLLIGAADRIDEFYWDGHTQTSVSVMGDAAGSFMRTSSSWEQEWVVQHRQALYAQWREYPTYDASGIPTFHLLTDPDDRRGSPFMERPDTASRSITCIAIDAQGGVDVAYKTTSEITPILLNMGLVA